MISGTYAGIVEDNRDPEKLGRLKVRVPHVYGSVGGIFGAVPTENIPWALPSGLPNGLSQQSGGCDWLPEIGDQVLVRFLDAEPEKPVWEWFMQTQKGAEAFKLHHYAEPTGNRLGKPKRGAWVRYGHTVEWNEAGLILTTSKGYRLLLTDASSAGRDGTLNLSTQAGQFLDLDDSSNTVTLNVNEDLQINVGDQMLALCDAISLQALTQEIELISGDKITLDSEDNLEISVGQDWLLDVLGDATFDIQGDWTATAAGDVTLNGTKITLSGTGDVSLRFGQLFLGAGASEPFVLGNQILAYLNTLYAALAAHTHAGVMSGGGTTAPMLPPPPAPSAALLSQVIKGS
jgi:hypothetical protein